MSSIPGAPSVRQRRRVLTKPSPELDMRPSGDFTIEAFGRLFRELCVARAMSVEDVAQKSGLSVGLISQLQRGIGNPSFLTIAKICYALDVPLSRLFEDTGTHEPLVRINERRRMVIPGLRERDVKHELLTPDLNRAIAAIWVETPPGHSTEERPFQHRGEEFGLVLRGSVEVHLGREVYLMNAGDSISYASTVAHWYRNPGRRTSEAIWIMTPPSF